MVGAGDGPLTARYTLYAAVLAATGLNDRNDPVSVEMRLEHHFYRRVIVRLCSCRIADVGTGFGRDAAYDRVEGEGNGSCHVNLESGCVPALRAPSPCPKVTSSLFVRCVQDGEAKSARGVRLVPQQWRGVHLHSAARHTAEGEESQAAQSPGEYFPAAAAFRHPPVRQCEAWLRRARCLVVCGRVG